MAQHEVWKPGALELEVEEFEPEASTLELLGALRHELGRAGLANHPLINRSIKVGALAHRGHRRTYEPYFNHPIRTTMRLLDFGITDPEVIAVGPVHDTIEDHPLRLALMSGSPLEAIPTDKRLRREMGYGALVQLLSPQIADTTLEVSNPLDSPDENKTKAYARHVFNLVMKESPGAVAVKTADTLDNGALAKGEDPVKRLKSDEKYKAVWPILIAGLERPDSLIQDEERRDRTRRLLAQTCCRALERLYAHEQSISAEPLYEAS